MPFMKDGDLFCKILSRKAKNKPFKEQKIVSILYQLLKALNFIHEKKYIHGNITSSNILISKSNNNKFHVYLYNFRSEKKGNFQKTRAGIEDYMSKKNLKLK